MSYLFQQIRRFYFNVIFTNPAQNTDRVYVAECHSRLGDFVDFCWCHIVYVIPCTMIDVARRCGMLVFAITVFSYKNWTKYWIVYWTPKPSLPHNPSRPVTVSRLTSTQTVFSADLWKLSALQCTIIENKIRLSSLSLYFFLNFPLVQWITLSMQLFGFKETCEC